MTISFPKNRKEVDNRAKADVKSQLATSNPWLKNSFLGALITGYAGRVYEFYLQMKNALLEMFPDTASGAYLERWGSYVGISRNPNTKANGYVVFTGDVGTVIPLGTQVSSSDGLIYSTTSVGTITSNTLSVSSLTRSSTTATVTTPSEHNLATGMTVTISGADQTAYNGDFVITVTDADTFKYTVSGAPASPATGTITMSVDSISIPVESVDYGQITNQVSGAQLTVSSPISGADSTVYVPYLDISSGTDEETDEEYRARVIYRYQHPIALFNVSAITVQAFETPGVTRVWVKEAGSVSDALAVSSVTRSGQLVIVTTSALHNLEDGQYVTISGADQTDYNVLTKVIVLGDYTFAYAINTTPTTPATGTILATPSIPNGQVKVYFMRDDDTNPIPSSLEVQAVKDKILEIKPAHVASGDVIVKAPVGVSTDFVFTELTPNTQEMQTAIANSLTTLFTESIDVGVTIPSHAYIAAIWQTVDEKGNLVESFTLSSPAGDVAISEGQIGTLGTITYP